MANAEQEDEGDTRLQIENLKLWQHRRNLASAPAFCCKAVDSRDRYRGLPFIKSSCFTRSLVSMSHTSPTCRPHTHMPPICSKAGCFPVLARVPRPSHSNCCRLQAKAARRRPSGPSKRSSRRARDCSFNVHTRTSTSMHVCACSHTRVCVRVCA